jgi:hypothetical protein
MWQFLSVPFSHHSPELDLVVIAVIGLSQTRNLMALVGDNF